MFFRQLFDPETWTYTYLLADEHSKEAILIDPVKEHIQEYLDLLKQYNFKLKYSLESHVHADHVTAGGELRDKTGCQTAMHELTKADCVSIRLKDGQELQFGKHVLKTIHTPGHTPCHASYLVKDRLFTGDSLFINGCGRTDFQKGSALDLWKSITQKLFNLPSDTLVYPGHDYHKMHVSTIQQEKDLNPRFLNQNQESFVELMNNLNLPNPKKIHEAVPANEVCGIV